MLVHHSPAGARAIALMMVTENRRAARRRADKIKSNRRSVLRPFATLLASAALVGGGLALLPSSTGTGPVLPAQAGNDGHRIPSHAKHEVPYPVSHAGKPSLG